MGLWPPRSPNSLLVGSICATGMIDIAAADVFISVMFFRFTSSDGLHLWMYLIKIGQYYYYYYYYY
jgi:hypothetical protein